MPKIPLPRNRFRHGRCAAHQARTRPQGREAERGGPAVRGVVLAAVRHDGRALQYAFVLAAVLQRCSALRYVALSGVTQNGHALRWASQELRGDRALVLAAITQCGLALQYAPAQLRGDSALVLAAVRQWGGALQYAFEECWSNVDVVLAAADQDEASAARHARVLGLAGTVESGSAVHFRILSLLGCHASIGDVFTLIREMPEFLASMKGEGVGRVALEEAESRESAVPIVEP